MPGPLKRTKKKKKKTFLKKNLSEKREKALKNKGDDVEEERMPVENRRKRKSGSINFSLTNEVTPLRKKKAESNNLEVNFKNLNF